MVMVKASQSTAHKLVMHVKVKNIYFIENFKF